MAKNIKFRIIVSFIIVITLIGAFLILNRPESSASEQSTDDAYVQADFTTINPQVSGIIMRVAVADNQDVSVGTPLISIDDRELRIAVTRANAQVASEQANVETLRAQLNHQQSVIEQARAAVAASKAHLSLAEANLVRFTNLAHDGSGTIQAKQKQQAESERDVQRAAYERDTAGLHSAQQQVAVLRAEGEKALADLLGAQAEKTNADLNLSYTQVIAPVNGVVAQHSARVPMPVAPPVITAVFPFSRSGPRN